MRPVDIPKTHGALIRVSQGEFRKRQRVDVREFYDAGAGDWRPTKKGVSLPIEDLPLLLSALHEVEADAIRTGDLLAEDYNNAGLELPPAFASDQPA